MAPIGVGEFKKTLFCREPLGSHLNPKPEFFVRFDFDCVEAYCLGQQA